MRKKFFLSKWKKLIAFNLSLIIALSTLISSFASEYDRLLADTSSATQRVTNFIGLAAGKTVQDLDSSLNLTKDELRFLGVYLSNFFIPFGTELGTTEASANESTKAQIVTALQADLNFSDDLADTFAETIMGLSRSNCQELSFRVSKTYQDNNYVEIPNFKVNYYNFLRLMFGGTQADSVFEGYIKHSSNSIFRGIGGGKTYEYGYFGYVRDGEFIPMFDCSFSSLDRTPCQEAFLQCLMSVDINMGYGFSFFDFTSDEAKNKEALTDMLSTLDTDTIYRMSNYGSTMNVDCFGNIILKGANHQYIVVPGCMNPYTWVPVNEEGEDLYNAGTSYNVVTFMGLGLADTGKLFDPASAIKTIDYGLENDADKGPVEGSQVRWCKLNVNNLISNNFVKNAVVYDNWFKNGDKDSKTKVTLYPLKFVRGGSDYSLTGTFFNNSYYDLVDKATTGFINANAGDYSYYASIYKRDGDNWKGFSLFNETPKRYIAVKGSGTFQVNSIRYLDTFAFIDNLGAFHFDDSEAEIDYKAINIIHYINEDKTTSNALFANWGADPANGFSNMYKSIKSGDLNTTINAETAGIVGTYVNYALAGLYDDNEESKKATIGLLGYRMNRDGMVSISNDPISLPTSMLDDMITESIRDWIYYILNPSKGFDYVRILITNKTEALLVGWHNDMVGTNGIGATTGTTLYKSNIGYVTTPDLSELEWTSALIDFYEDMIPFLIILMVVTMLFAYITGILPLQRCVFGVAIFSAFLVSIVSIINGIVGVSNRVSQNLYGERFTYWALVQQESYADALDSASSGESYENYLRTLYATNSSVYSNQGSDSVVLKWQAPKKMASLMLSTEDTSLLDNLSSSRLLSLVLNDNSYSGESYLDRESSYMYRSYTDIGNFSRYIYNGIKQGTQDSRSTLPTKIYSNVSKELKESIETMDFDYNNYRTNGYSNKNGDGSSSTSGELRTVVPLSSEMYNNAIKKKGTVSKLGIKSYVGINQDVFNFSVAMFNNSSEVYKENLLANCSPGNETKLENYLRKYTDKDITGIAAYSIMSESPFYYFSWALYDMGMSTSSNASNGYKSLLLGQENGGFFYNNKGNGELKDFMDMKSLFTYVIPYLKEGNDLVREWDDVYGLFVYDGVPTEEGHQDDTDIKNNAEIRQKYWHNLNVARLYEVYTPWVDLMYDCSYAKPETITVLGEKYIVKDPINPASYPEGRPMIFSESEMYDYGLSESDLTEVERRILKCNEGMQKRMYELLNYYNFSDLTLNTASAINCAFEFNIIFSDSGLFKDNVNLYPQSFEISNFSYDAFLRFILSSATGSDITAQDDFYLGIVQNSSITTIIIMLVLDILSQYALPAFKLFFLVAILLSVISLILITAFKLEEKRFLKSLSAGVTSPLLQFLVVTVGFSWVISLFMGVGNNAVTQSEVVSISMGDPVMVMLVMCAVDIGVMLLYFNIVKGVVNNIIRNFKMTASFVSGLYGGMISNTIGKLTGSISGGSSSSSKGSVGNSDIGLGKESSRATRRAGESREDKEERSKTKEVKRRTILQGANKKPSSKAETDKKSKELNNKLQNGLNKMLKK